MRRVCGRPELSQLPLGSGNLAVSTSPPDPSCATRSEGTADRGDSHLPGLDTGLVVASSLQDVGSAYSVASSLPSVPELSRFHQVGGIQYGSFSGCSHSGLQVAESDDDVVLDCEDLEFLSHHIATNTAQKYNSPWQQFLFFLCRSECSTHY